MDDFTLAPLLNAALHANYNYGIQQLIESPLRAAAAAALPPSEGGSPKKIAKKKKSTANNVHNNYLKHPNSDSHKLETNQLLLETASRIEDAILELQLYANILAADGSVLKHRKDNSRAAAANNIRNSIVPLLQITANTIRDAGKCFAPYTGTERLHDRNDVERRRKLLLSNTANVNEDTGEFEKSPSLLMIDDFVKRSNWSPPPITSKTNASLLKKKTRESAASNSVTLLKPRNGSTYTKSEVIAIAKQHKKGKRGKIYRAMIQQAFVPVSRSALTRLMQKFEKGEEILETEWSTVGRPRKTYELGTEPKPIDCSLTFDDLDTEDNRIIVYVGNCSDEQVDEDEMGDETYEGAQLPQKRSFQAEKDQKPLSLPKKKRKVEVSAKVAAFEVPPPRDGSVYTKSEFVEVIKTFIPSKNHNLAMRAMMHRGYVGGVTVFTLRRLIKKDREGEPIIDSAWNTISGRPPKVRLDEINEIVDKIKREDLRIYDFEDVKQLLLQTIMQRNTVDETMLSFSDRTVVDYFAMLKSKLSPLYWKKVEDEGE